MTGVTAVIELADVDKMLDGMFDKEKLLYKLVRPY
jgi:hypothetical protein